MTTWEMVRATIAAVFLALARWALPDCEELERTRLRLMAADLELGKAGESDPRLKLEADALIGSIDIDLRFHR